MQIGIVRETKSLEGRVALIPAAAGELVNAGHAVMIEKNAGQLSGYNDAQYQAVGVKVLANAAAVYEQAQLIVKVKEPIAGDLALLREHHILFSYLHLAAELELIQRLQAIGLTAVAFETVTDAAGRLPLLAPMSDIAGRLATQIGSNLLHQPHGGKGLLLGGLPAAERGRVVILGAGVAGGGAATLAAALGAEVVVFDKQRDRLAAMRALGNNVTALYPYPEQVDREVRHADLLIGAVLVTGEKAPHLVSARQISTMTAGSVVVDISVDQGGCIETTRPTTYADPTYRVDDVVHFAVTNMPGAVPRTASQALSAALMPYVLALAQPDWQQHQGLRDGINVQAGQVCHPALVQYVT
jgi:alanine dehydrogenase